MDMSSLEKPVGLSSLVGVGGKTERTTRALQARFLELVEKVRQTRPASDIELLRRAFDFAAEQHRTQLRKSGDPYLSHPLEVAHILADMKLDITTLCAALLHDVVEDTRVSTQRIAERFGQDIATLVEGVTKINRLDLLAPEARQAENVRKMLLAMVNDVRVVVVKLADRLHNMRTLGFLAPEKQQRIARETLDIYSPIAHRLGMGLIRGELEDIAFSYLEPEAYQQLQNTVVAKRKEFEAFLAELKDNNSQAARGKRNFRRSRRPREAPVFHSPEKFAPAPHRRSDLRPAGRARHYRHHPQLLRGARRDPPGVAARPRPVQGLHRHAPPQSLPVAAHHGDPLRADV